MGSKLFEPLSSQVSITDETGKPTAYFTRVLQKISLGDGMTAPNGVLSYVLPDNSVTTAKIVDAAVTNAKLANMATKTIKARKSGTTGAPEDCSLSDILDFVGSAAQGDILFRGATGWTRLAAGTSGNFLKTQGAGADPVWAVASGGGGTKATPTIRNQTIVSSSSASYTVTWPTGTIAGDIVLIFMEHGNSPVVPAGWLQIERNTASTAQGMIVGKVMTSADITAGSVTVTATAAFNGTIATVTLVGTTVGGITGSSSGNNAGSVTSQSTACKNFNSTDLILGFGGWRATSNITFDANWSSLAAVNGTSASSAVAKFIGTANALGGSMTVTSSVAGPCFFGMVALQGV